MHDCCLTGSSYTATVGNYAWSTWAAIKSGDLFFSMKNTYLRIITIKPITSANHDAFLLLIPAEHYTNGKSTWKILPLPPPQQIFTTTACQVTDFRGLKQIIWHVNKTCGHKGRKNVNTHFQIKGTGGTQMQIRLHFWDFSESVSTADSAFNLQEQILIYLNISTSTWS